MRIIIPDSLLNEALIYSRLSRQYTSNRHDFHSGGLDNKQKKMFEGKIGEKAIKKLFIDENIKFEEDTTSHEEADFYDFIVHTKSGKRLKVDVKTRTKAFHTRTLEMVEQLKKKPKDIYISVRLYDKKPIEVEIIGYALKNDFIKVNRIQNQGYLDNYVLFDTELHSINTLLQSLQKNE
ncbi:hypothetical protein [Salinimicrobium soli]|uniref:hypothetical protein n=1 Tax=Salinimicrobium soli TaxID=1254399 RepID=UPI003AAACF2C